VSVQAEVLGAAVRELIAQAQRLGLSWSLRPGTVQSTAAPYDPYRPAMVLDGDADAVPMPVTSLAGPLVPGMRVMVAEVPPAGRYALGVISTADLAPRVVSLTTASPLVTGEGVSLVLPAVRLRAGAAYRVEAGSAMLSTSQSYYRVRKGSSVAGALLATGGLVPGYGLAPSPGNWALYLGNRGSTDITTDLVLTVTAVSGQAMHYATAAAPRYLMVQYAGPVSACPQAITVT